MSNPVNAVADAIRRADGDHTMGAAQLAEVAIEAVCKHIAEFRSADISVTYSRAWNDCLTAVLTTLGHGEM